MKKGIIYSFIISLVICMIMPFSVSASTTGNQVGFTNNTSYSGSIKLYRVEIQPQTGYTGNTYTYGYYFQTDPGMYGLLSGNFDNSNNDVWSVAVQNGISEMFYSNKTSCYLKSTTLVEYNQTLPQEVIDYIANLDANVELTTELLDKLILLRQWNFPIESFSAVYNFFDYLDVYDFKELGYWKYPVFKVKQNEAIFNFLVSPWYTYTYIFATNLNIVNYGVGNAYSLETHFNIPSNLSISNFQVLNDAFPLYNGRGKLIKLTLTSQNNTYYQITQIDSADSYFIPFYYELTTKKNISTDFALYFGLTNQVLDDLHVIAQGTQQSQSAAGDLEQGTSDLASDISSYNQIESDYNNQMNQALNNIDFSDQFSNNQNFLSGASFVKTVFNSFMQIDILRIFFIILCIVLIAKRFI